MILPEPEARSISFPLVRTTTKRQSVYIAAVIFIGGGNRNTQRKSPISRNKLFRGKYTNIKHNHHASYVIITAYPCNQLVVPNNHTAKVCTDWMSDYGQYCLAFCDKSFTMMNDDSYDQWYVCGASGKWIPSSTLSKCESKLSFGTL